MLLLGSLVSSTLACGPRLPPLPAQTGGFTTSGQAASGHRAAAGRMPPDGAAHDRKGQPAPPLLTATRQVAAQLRDIRSSLEALPAGQRGRDQAIQFIQTAQKLGRQMDWEGVNAHLASLQLTVVAMESVEPGGALVKKIAAAQKGVTTVLAKLEGDTQQAALPFW
jgi:hypothetical protein